MAAQRTVLGALWRWLAFLALAPVVLAEAWALLLALGGAARSAVERGPGVEALALAGGAAAYALVHLALHKPITTYVFGHELSHVVWAWLTGHRVGKIRVGRESGHVETAGTNFLVRLGPYFFPLYALLLLAGWGAALLAWPGLKDHSGWLFAGLGFTYAFHVMLTVHALRGGQSDLRAEGYCFSMALILAVNLQLLAALVAAASPAVTWLGYQRLVGRSLGAWAAALARLAH